MKLHSISLCLATLACASAFAQSPAGTLARPAQEQNPNASGGVPQARAEAKTEAKIAAGVGTTGMGNSGRGYQAMDRNGDGMITRKEWDAHHAGMWRGMKADKRGMVPWSDVDARLKGGPN